MNPVWITYLTFAATAMLVGALISLTNDVFFQYRSLVSQRLDELSGKSKGDGNASLFQDLKQLDAQASAGRRTWHARFQELIEQSGLQVTLQTLASISLCAGVGLGIFVALVSKRWWTAPLGLVPGLMVPVLYVVWKRRQRMQRLALQLPNAFDVIGRAVRAGQTVPAAFQIVADDFELPISEEFRRCYDQQSLGMSHDTALRGLARRTGIMELRILVVALLVQSRSGGNLVELLSNLSTMVRKRLKLQQKVRALTGEGRMQALVLIILPVLAFATLLVTSPAYVRTLLERPWLLAGTIGAQLLGALWIRRIVNFGY
jgi:tight adherence protein B